MSQDKTYGQDPIEPLGLSREQRLQSDVNELFIDTVIANQLNGNGTGEPRGILNAQGIAEVPPGRRALRAAEKRGRVIT